jgi:hypothetical protein
MNDLVADAIRFYYQDKNDVAYLERCRAPLEIADVIMATLTAFSQNVRLPGDSWAIWPAYEARVNFGTYTRDRVVAEFDTELLVSKLARVFHVRHGFSVENHHEERVEPTLFGYGNTGYTKEQFNLHEMLRQRLTACGYTELDLADMDEVVPTLAFPEGVTIFGRQVSVRYALFHDLRGLCPAD